MHDGLALRAVNDDALDDHRLRSGSARRWPRVERGFAREERGAAPGEGGPLPDEALAAGADYPIGDGRHGDDGRRAAQRWQQRGEVSAQGREEALGVAIWMLLRAQYEIRPG